MKSAIKLLFVCSRNRWRSPTAEALFHGAGGGRFEARSAGTEPSARVRVNEKAIGWADRIFCMEKRHVERLRERFGSTLFEGKEPVCLDIPDDYGLMDPELVALLEAAMSGYLELSRGQRDGNASKNSARGG